MHLPGSTNLAADAASRHPFADSNDTDLCKADTVEPVIAAAIRRDAESMSSITWECLASETAKDIGMLAILDAIRCGFPDSSRSNETVATYWRYRHSLYERCLIDGGSC